MRDHAVVEGHGEACPQRCLKIAESIWDDCNQLELLLDPAKCKNLVKKTLTYCKDPGENRSTQQRNTRSTPERRRKRRQEMTNQREWTLSRFLLSLGALALLATPILPGCIGPDGFGNGEDPIIDPVDDDDGDDDDDAVVGTSMHGIVRGADGMPVEGVTVTLSNGFSAVTDFHGSYSIDEVDAADRILINFSKMGYAKSQTPFAILENTENFLSQTLAEVDFTASFQAADGLAFDLDDGAGVTLPAANFVDADGNVYEGEITVEATSYDLTSPMEMGNEIFAVPGDFTAIDAEGADQTLESYGMLQVNMWGENGEELNLGETSAPVLMPMQIQMSDDPEIQALIDDDMPMVGDTIPAWSYNESTGKWVEEAMGTVVEIDGNLFWEFEAAHFSTWNCDYPLPTHGCVTGQVTNAQGQPRQGATVRAVGMTYTSTTTARTTGDGTFCLEVKNGETVWLEISYTISGQPATQRTDPVTIPAGQSSCTDGNYSDCVDMGVIPVDIMSCVTGVVIDNQNMPVVGADVVSPQGGIATTDSSGAFCLAVPVFQATQVYVLTGQDDLGYQPVQMYTQPGLPDCQSGCPNIAVLRPYTSTSCASGEVIINSQSAPNILVEAYDASYPDVAVFSTLTNEDGSYCVEIPAGGEVTVMVGAGDNVCGSENVNASSLGGEVCDESSQSECASVPNFVCSL
jgi:hypothetical protein